MSPTLTDVHPATPSAFLPLLMNKTRREPSSCQFMHARSHSGPFAVMNKAFWHRFQVLTKRSDRLRELSPLLTWAPNIWMGVSVETEAYLRRIDDLRETGAAIKFLSCEPLLGPLPNMRLTGIDWVIVGGESGPGARKMEEPWVVDIRDQCQTASVPFFFKQWGGTNKKKAGRLLEGRIWSQLPKEFEQP